MNRRRALLADALGLAVILLALRELAIHHEHRSRDLSASLAAVEQALGLLSAAAPGRAMADFARRHDRILRKLARIVLNEREPGDRQRSTRAGP